MTSYTRRFFITAAAVIGFSTLAALPVDAQAASVVEAARNALPDPLKSSSTLKVATSLQWPPFAYMDEKGEMEGIDIRLVRLLGEKLGLKVEIEDVKFPSIVPGVSNGRYDVGVNQIGITPERAKVADFVPYLISGFSLLVRKGTTGIDVYNLCGRTLALTQGSGQIPVAEKLSAQCVQEGKKEISFLFFPNSADTYLALSNGRGDGFLVGKPAGVYIAKSNPKLEMTTSVLKDSQTIAGIVIAKGNTALQKALMVALEDAVADGSYHKILEEFGVPDAALTVEQIHEYAKQ
ncbi:ABC transporter substrate-binding protein [Microvirga massiliensis]|uniref:ABC transporter substrate-binding protein n=1 Tax=Microvirga massiliensis TaxID=1033741 RepID=UPI00062BC2A2|nr:ABC transporter substrate-binding protein [Microvirga massiliensis]